MLIRVSLTCLMVPILILINGCATTYSHFGRFSGENSAGEAREFLLEWDSTSSAFSSDDEGSNVRLKSQCSSRLIEFQISSDEQVAPCADSHGNEAVFCGRPGEDLTMEGKDIKSAGSLCGYIKGTNGEFNVGRFGKTVAVTLHCFPAATTQGEGDEAHNVDYLKASAVPYIVTVKKVVKGSTEDRPPELNSRVCGN